MVAAAPEASCSEVMTVTPPAVSCADWFIRFAVTTMTPLKTPALAKLPTLDSQGLKGFNVTIWHALYAPKGTPAAAVEKINAALKAALKDVEFIKREEALGAVVVTDDRLTPAGHKKFVAAEIAKWGPAIKAAGQYAD